MSGANIESDYMRRKYDCLILVDLVGDYTGHYVMMQALQELEEAIVLDTRENTSLMALNPIKELRRRYKMLRMVMNEVKKYDGKKVIVHFLTADKFYPVPMLSKLFTKNRKVIFNVHAFPKSFLRLRLLKNAARKVNTLVVFSERLVLKAQEENIHNVVEAHWPSFYDYSKVQQKDCLKKKYNIEGKTIISVLGGTRYDKGIDILIRSMKYVPKYLRDSIVVNIAGKLQYFTEEMITTLLQENDVQGRITLRSLSDEEFCENVVVSDIMAIPYRKSFCSGASGPMTEAMCRCVPSVFPKNGNLGIYEEKYHVGKTFECENEQSLGETITDMIINGFEVPKNVAMEFSREHFKKSFFDYYNSLFD